MFGFDGEYRRRPTQSLGGASQTADRETVIKKAQQERQKRNELRRQNNGAVIIQSYTRSFIERQRRKRLERDIFDQYMLSYRDNMNEDASMSFLLQRILYFYDLREAKDSERMINLCQNILRNPARLLQNSAKEFIWLHRLMKLLDLCIIQLSAPHSSQAIPLRMLETFTSTASIQRFVENAELMHIYLEKIFLYLIRHKFFERLRLLLQKKCPPLDGETLQPPNHFVQALYELMLRPLQLAQLSNNVSIVRIICQSFALEILSLEFMDPIKNYLLPAMAETDGFPFEKLILTLAQLNDGRENNNLKTEQSIEPMQVDIKTPSLSMEVNNVDFTTASTTTKITLTTKTAISPPVTDSMPVKANKTKVNEMKNIFSCFLLNALLILDRKNLIMLHSKTLLGDYIKVIAKVSSKILYLPKSTLKITRQRHLSDETSSDDDDDDNENNFVHRRSQYNMEDVTDAVVVQLSDKEKEALLESIELLNESKRVGAIAEHIEHYIEDTSVLNALCEIFHNLMIYNKMAIFEYKLLYTFAFMPKVIRGIWFTLADQSSQMGFNAPLTLISKGVVPKQEDVERLTIPLLATFCMLFGRLLPTLHDIEFCEDKLLIDKPIQFTTHVRLMPFSMPEILQLSKTLKEISMGLVELAFPETRSHLNQHYRFVLGHSEADDIRIKKLKQIWSNLLKVVVFVLNQIYTRDLRLGFCPKAHWTVSHLDLPLDRPTDLPLTRSSRIRGIRPFQPIRDFTREDFENGPPMSTKQIRSITILREIPFVVDFSKRVGILQGLVAADKMRVQGNFQAFLQGPSIMLTIRRSHLYEDAYDKLRPENEPDLRLKFRVQFVSSLGMDEAGIDGGGVFREFLTELIKTAFDPNRGFFMVTTDNKLYPNPGVGDLFPDYEKHYYFIGRTLGKAIYENLLVELPLAEFFLTKLAGKYADVDIHQLASLDPELYKNLLYLKDYEGDVSELGLDFTVASSSFGQTNVVELKPNGQSFPVTASNRIEYLQLMADYKLNVQIRKHCTAFRKGLSNVLPVEWLYMFSNKELQILISGAEIPIDLEDLKKHCQYGGEYSPEHPSIVVFWSVLEDFNDIQRRQLLKFVTSCSRPPLLGFKDLDPPFFIQNAGDMERLPTASTCTNLLKLPPFKTEDQMREKLLYAIQSGVGFELS